MDRGDQAILQVTGEMGREGGPGRGQGQWRLLLDDACRGFIGIWGHGVCRRCWRVGGGGHHSECCHLRALMDGYKG